MRLLLEPLRWLLILIRDADGGLTWLSTFFLPTQYQKAGTCKRRGVCCKNIAVHLSPSFWRYPVLRRLAICWYEFVYGFFYMGELEADRMIMFSCSYLDSDNRCRIYWRRPYICRRYPQPRFFGQPTVLPGCGYSFKLRIKQ